jgi:hypothetical protein
MPLSTHGLNCLTNDWESTLLALRGPPLGALSLTIQTPCVAILFDVAHALLERITTFGTKEMAEMPVLTKSDSVLSQNGGLAVLALGSIYLMPVKVTKVAKSSIAILGECLTFYLWHKFTSPTALDTI